MHIVFTIVRTALTQIELHCTAQLSTWSTCIFTVPAVAV